MGLLWGASFLTPRARDTTWREVSLHDNNMLGVVEYEQLPRLNF